MCSLHIAVADSVFPDLKPAEQAFADLDFELSIAKQATPDAIVDAAGQADALLVTYAQVTADIIGRLARCRVIGRFGIGTDNIDIAAATEAGIVVTYAPVYCLEEVSDHAMALLLALARKIPYANGLASRGRWDMPAVVPIHRLKGQTLGLVGFGNIPQRLVPKAQAFGMRVTAFDPYADDGSFAAHNVQRVEFDRLLAESDFVSIHAPLTDETRNMFDQNAFAEMKPTAFVINTARGPLVDIDALVDALDACAIAGAALDVMPVEPPPADCALLNRDNVILTPHTGFYSEEALFDLQTTVAADVAAVLQGEAPRFPVNPQVLSLR